jgi:hypothetical protein
LTTDFEHGTAPARIGVLTAVRRHWLTALLPFVLLVGAAVELGLRRTPQYTATADLSVGTVFVSDPVGIASAIQGTESLAEVYSRVIHANGVVTGTARRLAERSLPHTGRVSATPIADSPMIRVTAVASAERQAVALANAAGAALADYVNRQSQSEADAAALSQRYRRAALRYRHRLRAKASRGRLYRRDPTEANKRALDRSAAAADTARLERNSLFITYQGVVEGTTSRPALDVFATATSASSDRYRVLQILIFTGAVGGVLAGAALALFRAVGKARRETRRTVRQGGRGTRR